MLGNPILLATLAGASLSLSGLGLWQPLDRTISLVGYTAAPCMLLALGLDLRQKLVLAMGPGPRARRSAPDLAGFLQIAAASAALLGNYVDAGHFRDLAGHRRAHERHGNGLIVTVLAEVYGAVPEESALTAVSPTA